MSKGMNSFSLMVHVIFLHFLQLAAIVPALAFFLFDRKMRCTLLGIAYDETPVKLSKIARNRRSGGRLYGKTVYDYFFY